MINYKIFCDIYINKNYVNEEKQAQAYFWSQ